jgi:hypothetical protein
MDSTPTPTTIGELAIYMGTKLEFIEKQLEGLPSRVQALEADVQYIKQKSMDRRLVWFTILGWIVAIGAAIAGVIIG